MNASAAPATIRLHGRVLVCSPDAAAARRLAQIVTEQASETATVTTLPEAAAALEENPCDVCIVDEPPDAGCLAELERTARSRQQPTQFIVLPAIGQRQALAAALPSACELLEPPLTREKLHGALFAALGRSRIIAENDQLKRRLLTRGADDMVGQSPEMLRLRELIQRTAEHRHPVLIHGEGGSGTNVVARALHRARFGGRRPVVRLRCRVLSGAAIEHELFGSTTAPSANAPSANTPSANAGSSGVADALRVPASDHGASGPPSARADSAHTPGLTRLQQAAGGTLVLDDVDAMPLPAQERLTRYLSSVSMSAEPDEASPSPPPPCIVATTHVDLRRAVQEGRFRADLCDLLTPHTLTVPPLRDRMSDLGLLAEHWLAEYATREGKPTQKLAADAIELLKTHHWPGNVRELNNVLERCCAINMDAVITASMIAPWLEKPLGEESDEPGLTLKEMERKLIEATFSRYGGNRELTARALKIGLRTLSGKLREYGYPPRGGPGSNRKLERRAA